MGEHSSIEWTHHTFNPWWGCDPISPACDHCYAQSWATRVGMPELWKGQRRFFSDAHWRHPLSWNRKAREAGKRARVFCLSMGDIFDNHEGLDALRTRLWQLIRETPDLDWLLLSKRIGNAPRMLPADWGSGYANVWLGATVVNQEEADRDIPKLLQVPASVRFLSCEPLLGPIDLTHIKNQSGFAGGEDLDVLRRAGWRSDGAEYDSFHVDAGVDWVIVGGESGSKARPMHPEWARSLQAQCQRAAVPFFFKQWGEWLPGTQYEQAHRHADPDDVQSRFAAREWTGLEWSDWHDPLKPTGIEVTYRVGKLLAGRMLDGQTYGEFPR